MNASEKTVLVIDDNDIQRKLTKMVLGHHGYRTLDANCGALGLSVLSQEHVDIIVCDLRMPNMSGMEFSTAVRENSAYQNIPIIILTADETEVMEKPSSFGANAVCDKLSVNQKLVQQIRDFLK